MYKYIEIIETDSEKVVKRIDITNHTQCSADRIENGANINLNHDDYHTDQNEYETEQELNPKG